MEHHYWTSVLCRSNGASLTLHCEDRPPQQQYQASVWWIHNTITIPCEAAPVAGSLLTQHEGNHLVSSSITSPLSEKTTSAALLQCDETTVKVARQGLYNEICNLYGETTSEVALLCVETTQEQDPWTVWTSLQQGIIGCTSCTGDLIRPEIQQCSQRLINPMSGLSAYVQKWLD